MKRQPVNTESLVYAYACSTPLSGAEQIDLERERIRQLWNRLVDIEREAGMAQNDAAAADVPALAELFAGMAALTTRIREAANRTAARALAIERRALERQTWPLLSLWRKANKQACDAIEDRRRARVIEARQQSGCYWGNSNNTLEDYESARKTVRQFGRRLRHIDEPDYGCLTVQVQRTRSGLGASPTELQDGTFAHVQIGAVDPHAHDPHAPRGTRRKLCRTMLEIRVDAEGHMARLPFVFHRPLPADARIKSVQVTWRKVADRVRWRACFTVSRPATQRPTEGEGIARVRLCWEAENGALVVARDENGHSSLELPPMWMTGMDRVAELHGSIDAAFDALGPREERSPHDLYQEIRAGHRVGRATSPALEGWYRLHDRWYREMIGLRAWLLAQRTERYRLWALDLARRYARIEIEAPASLAAHAQAERGEEANSLRHRAALHSLLLILPHMARKHGAAVEVASAPVVSSIDPSKIRKISKRQREKLSSAAGGGSQDAPSQ